MSGSPPVDVNLQPHQAIALGLTFQIPQHSAVIMAAKGRGQTFADDHALAAQDRFLVAGVEAGDQTQHIVARVGDDHADACCIARICPGPEEVAQVSLGIRGEVQLRIGQTIAARRVEIFAVDAIGLIQDRIEGLHGVGSADQGVARLAGQGESGP
ncbi:MAG: hypothetical protein HC802_05140 [Caldilineaceae bacterium]|nr:hypothetical protein [Caldilineaceae bacterium]